MKLPLIRRLMPEVIAGQLVDVQPLTEATGKVFNMNSIEDWWEWVSNGDGTWTRTRMRSLTVNGAESKPNVTEIGVTIGHLEYTRRKLAGEL